MVRFVDSETGGEPDAGDGDGLAPVTPLFGSRAASSAPRSPSSLPRNADEVRQDLARRVAGIDLDAFDERVREGRVPAERVREERVPAEDTHAERPIDLAAARDRSAGRDRFGGSGRSGERRRSGGRERSAGRSDAADPAGAAAAAENGLLKKLRARQLSVSEAETYLRQQDLDASAAATIIDAFLERGYLDDARLAEQLVHAGVDRKGQGRQALALSMAKRGVPRDVADAALAELPDDDAERALEFARTKAPSMRSLDRDVALRRLVGQLARRGYGGSVAMTAARTALEEADGRGRSVRFV